MNNFTIFFLVLIFLSFCQSAKAESLSMEKPLVIKWKNNSFSLLLLTKDEKLLTFQQGGGIISMSLSDGQILWRNNFGGDIFNNYFTNKSTLIAKTVTPTTTKETVHSVIAINTDTGTTKWRTIFSTPVLQMYHKENEPIILLTENYSLSTLNPDTGEITKSISLDSTNKREIHIIGSNTLLNQTPEAISLYNFIKGSTIWKATLPYKPTKHLTYINNTFFIGLEDGYIQGYDIANGKLYWSSKLSNSIQSIVPVNNGILVSTSDNYIYFLNLKGKTKWKKLLDGKFSNNFLVQDSFFLIFPVGSNTGIVLNLKNGNINNRIFLDESDTVAAPPVSSGKFLYVQTQKSLIAYSNN